MRGENEPDCARGTIHRGGRVSSGLDDFTRIGAAARSEWPTAPSDVDSTLGHRNNLATHRMEREALLATIDGAPSLAHFVREQLLDRVPWIFGEDAAAFAAWRLQVASAARVVQTD